MPQKNHQPQQNYNLAHELLTQSPRKVQQALVYIKRGIAAHEPRCFYVLGNWHIFGKGVEKDHATAAKLWNRAAELGDAEAACELAILLERAKKERQALAYYSLAAELGYTAAHYELGRCYVFGIGTKTDKAAAFKHYKLAAKQNNPEAWYAVAAICETGSCGNRKNKSQAEKYYRLVAESDSKLAKKAKAILRELGGEESA